MKNTIGIMIFAMICSSFCYPVEICESKNLLGVWIYLDYEDGIISCKKSAKFEEDEWGMQFKSKGSLVKRQNVGWCGTPPITYGNFKGTWDCISDSTIKIVCEYWGGTSEEELQIIELTPTILKFKRIEFRPSEEE